MKRVLVTGATGFIGAHALEPLRQRGFEVHAVTSRAMTPDTQTNWHQADLFDDAAIAALMAAVQPTHLLHFAWYVEPGHFWNSPENFRWVRASLGLLEAFAALGGQRVAMAGTCAEYDWTHSLLDERATPLSPLTPYSVCKHSLRLMLESRASLQGLSAAWGRIFFLYGPREYPQRLVASLIGNLLAGQPAPCSPGNQRRDFLHAADVADAFVALLDSEVQGPVNIASGEAVAVRDLALRIGDLLGRTELVQLGALPAKPEPPLLVGDIRRLSDEVGWAPRYTLESGLRETIDWWREAHAEAA